MDPVKYFKVTNQEEKHHDFQYQDGLNVLIEDFNDDPEQTCVSGGFYFTTAEHIHEFYYYGVYLREIELPTSDPEFKMVLDPSKDKWRANKIILGPKHLLSDLETFRKFNLPYPTLRWSLKNNCLELAKFLVENQINSELFTDYNAVAIAVGHNNLELVKFLLDHDFNIRQSDDFAFRYSIQLKYFDISKYLLERGANIHASYEYALKNCVENNNLEMTSFLIDQGANIHVSNDFLLCHSVKKGNFEMVQLLVNYGANIRAQSGYPIKESIKKRNFQMTQFLIKNDPVLLIGSIGISALLLGGLFYALMKKN